MKTPNIRSTATATEGAVGVAPAYDRETDPAHTTTE